MTSAAAAEVASVTDWWTLVPKWCVSSLSFMFSEKTSGETFLLEFSRSSRSLILDTSLSRLDPVTKKQKKQKKNTTNQKMKIVSICLFFFYHITVAERLTRGVVLSHSQRIQSCGETWAVGENSYSLSCQLWRCSSVTQIDTFFCIKCSRILRRFSSNFCIRVSSWNLLCEDGRQAAIDGGRVHVSILVGDEQWGLGLPLKQICAGLHEGLLHVPVKVGVFWTDISAVQTHKQPISQPVHEDVWTLNCGTIDHSYLNASRPVNGPVSVSGRGWLRKSFSISLAKDFCTSLQYGEWKTRKPKSSRLKRFSEPSVRDQSHHRLTHRVTGSRDSTVNSR